MKCMPVRLAVSCAFVSVVVVDVVVDVDVLPSVSYQ